MGFLPKQYGGGGISNIDLQIVAEEISAVDPGFATVLLVNGLALMPVAWFGSEEQKRKWIGEATADPRGEYIAGWTVSEPAGTPGGTANFDHPGEYSDGDRPDRHPRPRARRIYSQRCQILALQRRWLGSDGSQRQYLYRAHRHATGRHIRIERHDRAARNARHPYGQPISKLGHRLCQNNSVIFESCRVPEENAFAIGNGDLVISKAFTWSGPVAAIAAVGVARSAYEYVLKWAKTYTAGGDLPIIHHQAVGYLLADVAMKIEACRAFSWKAAHYLDQHDSEGQAVGAMAKVFCGETLFNAVFRTCRRWVSTLSIRYIPWKIPA